VPAQQNSLADAEILRLIGGRSAVNSQTAARIAEVELPQGRKLIRQKKLVGVGQRRFSRIGLRPEHMRELVRRGDVPSVPVGDRRRISERWLKPLKQWLAQGEVGRTALAENAAAETRGSKPSKSG